MTTFGGEMIKIRMLYAALVAVCASGGQATAQQQARPDLEATSPLVILESDFSSASFVVGKGDSVFTHTLVSARAAMISDEVWVAGEDEARFQRGTQAFGVKTPQGWVYCATDREGNFFFAGNMSCLQDADEDGRFDTIWTAGAPTLGVRLLVTGLEDAKPLSESAGFVSIPFTQGPSMELALRYVGKRRGLRRDKTHAFGLFIGPDAGTEIRGAAIYASMINGQAEMDWRGARFTVSETGDQRELRAEVLEGAPRQLLEPLTIHVTTSYTYY